MEKSIELSSMTFSESAGGKVGHSHGSRPRTPPGKALASAARPGASLHRRNVGAVFLLWHASAAHPVPGGPGGGVPLGAAAGQPALRLVHRTGLVYSDSGRLSRRPLPGDP